MTKPEFGEISAYLRMAYPTSNMLQTKESITMWFEELSDLDAATCMIAMKNYVRSKNYHPTIAEIREACAIESKSLIKPYNEAWEEVLTAVRKYGTYGAKEAVESLDDITRKCVKQIGFYEICTNPNTSFLKKEFKENYEEYKTIYDSKTQCSNGLVGIKEGGGREQRLITEQLR